MSAHDPLVSVLIPCYNVEKYLPTCLNSVLSQTLTDFEVICVNDGSTDATFQILNEYASKDQRIKIINKENSGYGDSMNQALTQATGKFIAILESDDFIADEALSVLTTIAEEKNIPVVKANFSFYWSSPTERTQLNQLFKGDRPLVINPLSEPAIFWYMPSIWSAIYRRNFLTAHNIKFLTTPGASYQDVSFTFKVWATAKKVCLIPDAFVYYRQDNENSSINSAGKVFAVAKEFAEIENFIADLPVSDTVRKKLTVYALRLKWDSYNWNYWRLTPEARKSFFKHFRDTFKTEIANGNLNQQYFFPWNTAEIRLLVNKPQKFSARSCDRYSGKTRYFWKILACLQENKCSLKKWKETKMRLNGQW